MDWQTFLWIILGCFVSLLVFTGLVSALLYWRYQTSPEKRLIRRIGKLSFRDKLALAGDVFRDERIGIAPRLIVFGVLLYVAMPFDIIPDFIPVLGQLDDLGVLIFGLDFFIRNAPKEVVEEHMGRIARNDDELKHDLERAQGVLSNRATDLRATLDRILSRDREGDNS